LRVAQSQELSCRAYCICVHIVVHDEVVETASIRLPPALIQAIERAAAGRGVSRATLVREALEEYLRRTGSTGLGVLVDRLVTYPGSGVGHLATRGEEILRERFSGRRHRAR